MVGSILIAGKSGRVARDLVDEAGRLKLAVRALGRPNLDIEDRDSIARVLEAEAPRVIINAAALAAMDEAERAPERAFAVNCQAAARLAAAAVGAGIPLLHLSTDYVFDGSKGAPYREDDATAPLSVYGRSKEAGERAVLDAHPGAIVVRTSWVFGRHGTNFLTTMLRLAATESVVRVVADQRGTPTAGADLARALLAIAERVAVPRRLGSPPAGSSPGIYHIAGSGETTWLGLAEAIFAGWARRGHRVPAIQTISAADWPGPARRPRDSRLDCRKAERAFGIALPDWTESLARCLDDLAQSHAEEGRIARMHD
jgi:dTDP-4-dehydrorhamnose reductase